jgi:hypothetical protein
VCYCHTTLPRGPALAYSSPENTPFTPVSANVLLEDAFPLALTTQRPGTSSPSVSYLVLTARLALSGAFRFRQRRLDIGRSSRFLASHAKAMVDSASPLATALQYYPATDLALTQTFIREFTERIYVRAYPTFVDAATHTFSVHHRSCSHARGTVWQSVLYRWSRIPKLLLNPRARFKANRCRLGDSGYQSSALDDTQSPIAKLPS